MILKPGFFYFLIVFAAGFALGIVRVLLLVPQLGVRSAELIELPLMLAASVFAARWNVTRFNVTGPARRLGVGGIALGFLLFAEFGVENIGAVPQLQAGGSRRIVRASWTSFEL